MNHATKNKVSKHLRPLDIQVSRGTRVKQDRYGGWTCFCGNQPCYEGFHPCNLKGAYLDTDVSELYVCDRCGRIISDQTRRVLGFRNDSTLTEAEKARIAEDLEHHRPPLDENEGL